MRKNIEFASKGLTCKGWLYLPDNLSEGEKAATVVMAHGFSAVKETFTQAGEPKKLVVLSCGHFDVYEKEPWHEQAAAAATEWFVTYLKKTESPLSG